ncbi:hypothetical protein GB931_10445 [Modestobacter sp. I12A-02628]|uniref:Uncharacterized protein n=1 Tax=Goekera deserti TaxID=2497753 RepID=A0A7K3WBQ8_9ACTN|nr:hypothetical protein [Goekera deserti]MPQ98329.1 hypothetical protein [Goekera deserti]NDI48156.1 hypothetical protein [Goekera deserti]NEL53905.1 hypothetical protein [Goekera deserti]
MDSATDGPAVLLLDVDGVLNGLAGLAALPDGWQQGTYNGYLVSWDPTITARLRCWHDDGLVQIQWLTTWTTDADRLLAGPMGLPTGLTTHRRPDRALPTGHGDRFRGLRTWWKLGPAQEVTRSRPGRRVVWIDDDLGSGDPLTDDWLAGQPEVLVVAPDLHAGLTHRELDDVETWLRAG